MKLSLAISGLLLTLGLVAPASAHDPFHDRSRPGHWELIGTRAVAHRNDHDRVFASGPARYSQVKLCVYNRPIRLFDLDVVFHNGGNQDVPTRAFLRPGECTRDIDLNGDRRNIQFVNMTYETMGRYYGPDAFVRVFAR